ncbi:MAG: HD domain-containing protein [Endomicrobiales bacterium]|nr:HD domain-containing protein [Endomicrobiales bacterium]
MVKRNAGTSRKVHGLDKEISELKKILRSVELINSSIKLDTVLEDLMGVAKDITESEAASVLLLEEGRLCFIAASGGRDSAIKKVYLDKKEGVAGWIIENKKPVLIRDVSRDARFSSRADRQSGFKTRSIIGVPLKIEDEVIGVVEAVNKRNKKEFGNNDIRLLSSLSASAAMAINKARLYRDLNDLFLATIRAMANAIEAKDPYTRGHSERIRDFSMVIAREMGLSEQELKDIEISALLHDVGKIGVPEAVLSKQGKLTETEAWEMMKHPAIGSEMLCGIKQLKNAIPGIRHHQERYDGKGYPDRLKGRDIPLFARIIAVADTFDAMTSDRPYRSALSDLEAIKEIELCAGIQFDGACVDAFVSGYKKGAITSQKMRQTVGK